MRRSGSGWGAWALAGATGGCLLSGFGCLAATGTAEVSEPRYNPADYQSASSPGESAYWSGFHDGYAKRLKQRRATSAFLGGAAVTAATAVLTVGVIAVMAGPVFIEGGYDSPPPPQPY